MFLERVQSYWRLSNIAVADQLESFAFCRPRVEGLATASTTRVTGQVRVLQAAREDAIGNKLIPRPTGTSLGKNKRLVLRCRLDES